MELKDILDKAKELASNDAVTGAVERSGTSLRTPV